MIKNARHFDWVIIGAGVIGCAISRELSQSSSLSVALIEQNRVGSGATLHSGGFVRVVHSEPHITKLAKESLPFFLKYRNETGFNVIGTLFMPTQIQLEALSRLVSQSHEAHHPIYILKASELPEELRKLIPVESSSSTVIWEPVSGYADPLKSTLWLSQEAQKNGVELFESTKVEAIDILADQTFELKTSYHYIRAGGLVLCTGAWNEVLNEVFDLGAIQRTKAIQADFVKSQHLPRYHPAIIVENPDIYMRPVGGGTWLMGTATNEWNIDVSEVRVKNAEHTEATLQTITDQFDVSSDSLNPLGARVGFDAYTYGETGYLGAKSDFKNVLFATGWSGMGFKLFPAIAKHISNLVSQSRGEVL